MADYDFELPDFLEDVDTDTLHQKMLDMLPTDIDKTEGGFPWDFTRPTALIASELLEFYIPEILKLMFPQWATGDYLDYHAKTAGLERKSAGYATATLDIYGTAGTVIPAGTVFATAASGGTASIEFETLSVVTLDDDGYASVIVQALVAGTDSNVDAGTITIMSEPIEGITSITNAEKASGGTEEESDDDLRERIMDANSSSDVSYVGNNADYKRWAESVTGIGTAIVVPEWDGAETVKIVCLDSNGEAANETLLQAVYDYIMSPDDPYSRLAPPNVILTVAAPELVEIEYTFTCVLEDSYTMDDVESAFETALATYYKTASEDGCVKYIQVYALLAAVDGVSDFSDLLMNGSTSNIDIDEDQYPYTAGITGTEAD